MIKIKLAQAKRIQLEKFRYQASSRDSEKALMVLMNADGQSVADISSSLRRNPHTVRDWLKRYKAFGLSGLSRKFSPGRPDKKRKKVKERIKKILSNPPEIYGYMDKVWSVPLIAHDVKKNLKISVSNDTVKRALKSMGYTYKRPSKSPPIKAPSREEKAAAINRMINKIKEIAANEKTEIFALDESHFSTEPYLVQGWFFKRWPPHDTHQQSTKKSYVLWLLEHENTKILLEKIEQGEQL